MHSENFKANKTEYKMEMNLSEIKSQLIKMCAEVFEAGKIKNNEWTEHSMDFAQFVNDIVCGINQNKILHVADMVTGYENLPIDFQKACKVVLDNCSCNKI